MAVVIFDLNPLFQSGTSLFVYLRISGDAGRFGVRVIGVNGGTTVGHDLRDNFLYLSASQQGYGRESTMRLEFFQRGAATPPSYKAILSDDNGREYATT